MKTLKLVALTIPLFFASLNGCGVAQVAEGSSNRNSLMKLNIGDTKERVLEVMGKPITREAYPDKEFLIYYTGNGMGQEGSTPIKLVNGKVVGWGQNYIVESTNKKTQTIDLNVKQR